jgi:hypothetical protein
METTNKNYIRLKDYVRDIDERAERRYVASPLSFEHVEQKDGAQDESNIIAGYAAVFNKDSEDFGGWIERIAPDAFSNVLEDDAFALFNHSMNHVLGRNKVNVALAVDEVGLRYTIKLPDTQLARDLRVLVKDQIINKSSFAFTVKDERLIKPDPKAGGPFVRVLKKFERLYDVSPVTVPAYPDTSVGARSFKKMIATEEIRKSLLELKLIYSINKAQLTKTLNRN